MEERLEQFGEFHEFLEDLLYYSEFRNGVVIDLLTATELAIRSLKKEVDP